MEAPRESKRECLSARSSKLLGFVGVAGEDVLSVFDCDTGAVDKH
jgi:hypothetical protein